MIDQKDVQFFDDNGYLFLDEFIEKHIIEDIKKEISKTINQIKKLLMALRYYMKMIGQ